MAYENYKFAYKVALTDPRVPNEIQGRSVVSGWLNVVLDTPLFDMTPLEPYSGDAGDETE